MLWKNTAVRFGWKLKSNMTETALSRKKIQNGWAMYDWANSVYNLVIGSTIFPIFYDIMTTVKNADGTEMKKANG